MKSLKTVHPLNTSDVLLPQVTNSGESKRTAEAKVLRTERTQARSQVGKRGGSKIINVDLKWAWITKRGWVRKGDVPPPARSAEAFGNIDFATECKPICRHMTHTAL